MQKYQNPTPKKNYYITRTYCIMTYYLLYKTRRDFWITNLILIDKSVLNIVVSLIWIFLIRSDDVATLLLYFTLKRNEACGRWKCSKIDLMRKDTGCILFASLVDDMYWIYFSIPPQFPYVTNLLWISSMSSSSVATTTFPAVRFLLVHIVY